MSVATAPPPAPAPIEPPLWPISVALYLEMARLGVFPHKERIYLWKGRLAPRMTVHPPHSAGVTKTQYALHDLRIADHFVDSEQPMALRLEPSVPQPDVKFVRGRLGERNRDYWTTADVPLVVDVADSSLAADRALAQTYAGEGIPVYWIVNVPGRCLEVYSEPAAGAYNRITTFGPEDEVPVVLDDREVGRLRVRDLLP
jgi:hypothetical protein